MIDIESKIVSYREDTDDYRLCLTREEIDEIKNCRADAIDEFANLLKEKADEDAERFNIYTFSCIEEVAEQLKEKKMNELVIAISSALIMLILGTIFIVVHFVIESIRTTYYLHKNQKAWDKYAKGLDFKQRLNIFPEWIEEQRRINGTDFYYIPRLMELKDDTKK